ncbi:MAG: hypothetical protein WAK34_05285, partial [Rhodoplanes sp.]
MAALRAVPSPAAREDKFAEIFQPAPAFLQPAPLCYIPGNRWRTCAISAQGSLFKRARRLG